MQIAFRCEIPTHTNTQLHFICTNTFPDKCNAYRIIKWCLWRKKNCNRTYDASHTHTRTRCMNLTHFPNEINTEIVVAISFCVACCWRWMRHLIYIYFVYTFSICSLSLSFFFLFSLCFNRTGKRREMNEENAMSQVQYILLVARNVVFFLAKST